MQRGILEYPAMVGVRLTAQQAAKLRELAAADDRPPSTLARRILADALARWGTPEETKGISL